MKTYADIEYCMYQESRSCAVVGARKRVVEMIPWINQQTPLIVGLLMRSPLVSTGSSTYYYIIYDIDGGHVVDEQSDRYREYMEKLPSLENVSIVGQTLDFMEEMALRENAETAIEQYCEDRELSESSLGALKTLSDGLSPSVKELYQFFIGN